MRAICVIRSKPFGADIDPRVFAPPNNRCSLDEAKAFAVETRACIDEVFGTMTGDERDSAARERIDLGRLRAAPAGRCCVRHAGLPYDDRSIGNRSAVTRTSFI
jgi:hypothetical protein